MFIAVTPIGSSASDVSAAANAYVDYLCGGGAGVSGADADIAAYYAADGAMVLDGAGRWSGGGADYLGLEGAVDRTSFSWLLQGRHHRTAQRLISARGSAGRLHLKAGQATRVTSEGQPLWGLADIAARLELPASRVTKIVDEDSMVMFEGERFLDHAGMYKVLVEAGAIAQAVTMDQLMASDAAVVRARDLAEAVGVTRRHITEVCKTITDGDIEDRAGLQPRKISNEWHVDRLGAIEWSNQREAPSVRVGFDMTVTTEKSLSVFGLLGDPQVRAGTIEVLSNANDEALRWLNRMASTGRSKQQPVDSHGLAVASFMHSMSRNDDPFLHVHNVVLNAIADHEGVGRALDATGLYAQAPAAAALATASMRRELTERFGVDWRLSGRDTWEIAGIDDQVIETFSSRRSEIEAALNQLEDEPVSGRLKDEVASSTRGQKSDLSVDELTGRWDDIAASVGYDRAARNAVLHARPQPTSALTDHDRSRLWRWLESPEGVTANSACFDAGDLYWAIANWAPGGSLRLLKPNEIVREAQQWQMSTHVRLVADQTKVTAGGRRIGQATEPLWTTGRMLELQHHIASSWDRGRDSHKAVVPASKVSNAARRAEVDLSAEQFDLVRAWTSSGDAIQAAIGRPGTGKTTTMAVAVDTWEQAGFTVKGAAVKGEAARLLAKEAGVKAATVASYLASNRMGQSQVDANTVLIVDEASTLSEWDLGELIDMCADAGAALRLIGDPAQHTSVQAGGSWAHLVDRFATETPELRHQRRLKNPVEVQAAESVRDGDFDTAFAKLNALDHIQEFETWSEAYMPIIKRWWDLRRAAKPHPLVERTNANRQVLNSLAQTLRHRAGELGDIIAVGPKAFAVGDEVIAREPNKHLTNEPATEHVLNGSAGVIVAIDDDAMVVDFDDVGDISIPKDWAARPAGLDLAYAMTSYSVQGATNDASTSTITQGMSASELLVDLTRGRDENVLVAIGRGDDEFAPTPDDIAGQIARSVRVEDLRPVADRDPLALEVHRAGLAGLTLAEIAKKTHHTPEAIRDRAIDQRIETLRLLAKHHPPDAVVSLIGHQPQIVWRAARWEKLATKIATFNDRWPPSAETPTTREVDALSRPAEPAGQAMRARLVSEINTYRRSHTATIEVGL